MRIKSSSGFTMVELVVVLAIAAVLAGAAIFGIIQVQRSARDEDRKVNAANITKLVDDYFRSKGVYPKVQTGQLVWSTNRVQVGTRETPLTGYRQYSSTATDATKTQYAYSVQTDGYLLCLKLENGNWFKLGTSTKTCP